jgi:8-oxo-dGTP pyrophosphatase MutT (NUDIX family)
LSFGDGTLARLETILAGRPADVLDDSGLRRACVLIPLVPMGDHWSLLFHRRSESLALHRGQIAFPGGSAEPGEALEAAALREAEEEVGLDPAGVRLIGRLDDLVTHTGFIVAPFVGVASRRQPYVLQESEVVAAFEVPLEALLASDNPEVRYVTYRGGSYPTYFYHWSGLEIWGLTGRIVKSFLDIVWRAI